MVTGNGVSHGLVVTGRFIGCHVVLPHLIVVMVVVLCIVICLVYQIFFLCMSGHQDSN